MDWTHPEIWFTLTWYNRRQDEGKSRKKTATNAKWCNQQVLWRVKERDWRQKLVEEKGVINLPSKAERRREREKKREVPGPCPTPPRNFVKMRSQLSQLSDGQTDTQTDRSKNITSFFSGGNYWKPKRHRKRHHQSPFCYLYALICYMIIYVHVERPRTWSYDVVRSVNAP